MTGEILDKELSYRIVGLCMEVHNILGRGHSEIVYKDALQHEFRQTAINFSRERNYKIKYKDIILPHQYSADFVIEDKIVLEVNAIESLTDNCLLAMLRDDRYANYTKKLNFPVKSKFSFQSLKQVLYNSR